MSEHIEFNYASANAANDGGYMTSPELIASVEQHLARWQVANNAPRVYFERIYRDTWKVVYGDYYDYLPLATWALNAIETAALS